MADKKWPIEVPKAPMMPKMPLCHRMSGFLFTKPSSLVLGEPQTVATFDCQGTRCALFVQNADESGRPTGQGVCGDTMQAVALMQIVATLEGIRSYLEGDGDDDEPDETDPVPPGPTGPPAAA